MNGLCLFGFHKWIGCKCFRVGCEKTRDKGHTFQKWQPGLGWRTCCKCSRCGKTRDEAHDWGKNCEECWKCGETRSGAHDWRKNCEECSKCGKMRSGFHPWVECECGTCGKTASDTLSDCLRSKWRTSPDWGCTVARGIAAAGALGRMRDVQAVAILIRALKFSHRGIQEAAAKALVKIEDSRAIEPLALAAEEVTRGSSQAAEREGFLGPLQEFKTIFPVEAVTILGASSSAYARAVAAKMGRDSVAPEILDVLRTLIKDPDPGVRQEACRSLAKQPGEIGALIEALTDSDWWVRDLAAEALGDLRDPRGIEPLIAATVKCPKALFALFDIGGSRAFEMAIATLENDKWNGSEYQERAIYFLARTSDHRAVGPLITLLNKNRSGFAIKRALTEALAQFRDVLALPCLIEHLALWSEKDSYLLHDAISAIAVAHATTLTMEMLDSLLRLPDITIRQVREVGEYPFTYDATFEENLSFENLRQLAQKEMLRRGITTRV